MGGILLYNHLLTAFACVADCGSFHRAAEKLYLSAPSVMKQVNSLEKQLDLKLVTRTNKGVRLTPAGQIIYRHAKFLFDYSAKAIDEARQQAQTVEKTFCIGSSLLNPCKPFMDIWYRVNPAFPDYKLHIVPFEDDHRDILEEIASLGIKYDFFVGVCDSAEWGKLCSFYPLGSFQHSCAVSREHPLADKKKLTIEDLYGQTVMMVKAGDSVCVDRIRTELLRHPEISIEDTAQFYDIEVFNRCAQTKNVLITPECWSDIHPGLVTLPVDWDFPIPYGLLYAKNSDPDVLKLLSLLDSTTDVDDATDVAASEQ